MSAATRRLAIGAVLVVATMSDRRTLRAGEVSITFDSLTLGADDVFKGPKDGPFDKAHPKGLEEEEGMLGRGKFRPEQFDDYIPFDTAGRANGLIIHNDSKMTVTDLHMKILSDGMTF